MMYLTQANDLDHAATLTQEMTKKASLPVAGVYNPLSAKIAKDQGFQALYLSGAALSASLALPDLGVMTADELIYAVRGILRASNLPLIVDCDTGYGEILNLMTLSQALDSMGVAAIQIEDQVMPKKCGHLNDKRLIPVDDMCRKIVACKKSAKKTRKKKSLRGDQHLRGRHGGGDARRAADRGHRVAAVGGGEQLGDGLGRRVRHVPRVPPRQARGHEGGRRQDHGGGQRHHDSAVSTLTVHLLPGEARRRAGRHIICVVVVVGGGGSERSSGV